MKGWRKVLLGIGAALLVLIALGAVLLLRSGRWEQVKNFAGSIAQMKRSSEDLEHLQRERPFTPPSDGLIAPARLVVYLEICETLRPLVQPYEAWMEAHAGKQGDFKDAAEVIGFLGKVTTQAAEVLRSKGMTPRELAWLHRSVRKAMNEVHEKGGSPEVLDLLAGLRKACEDPGISAPLKGELQRKLERFDMKLKAAADPMSPNAELCLAHSDRIRNSDLGEFANLILEGAAKGKRRGIPAGADSAAAE